MFGRKHFLTTLFPQIHRGHSFFENRRIFDDPPANPPPGGGAGDPPADPPANPPPSDPPADPPKKENRFQKMEQSNKELKEKNDKLEAEKKEREDKELAEKGEFKKLWESEKAENDKLKAENSELKASSENLSEAVGQIVNNELEKVAEDDRELAGEIFDGKTDAQKLALLPKIQNRFGTDAGASGDKKAASFFGGRPPQKGKKPDADPKLDSLEKEATELRPKVQNNSATPAERSRYRNVMDEMSKSKIAQQKREDFQNKSKDGGENLI